MRLEIIEWDDHFAPRCDLSADVKQVVRSVGWVVAEERGEVFLMSSYRLQNKGSDVTIINKGSILKRTALQGGEE